MAMANKYDFSFRTARAVFRIAKSKHDLLFVIIIPRGDVFPKLFLPIAEILNSKRSLRKQISFPSKYY